MVYLYTLLPLVSSFMLALLSCCSRKVRDRVVMYISPIPSIPNPTQSRKEQRKVLLPQEPPDMVSESMSKFFLIT